MQNYNKKFNKKQEVVEEPEAIEEVIEEPIEEKTIEGVVNCSQLHVREEPTIESDSLGILKNGFKVRIYGVEPINGFYHICTEFGLEGYCMAKFITI